MQNSDIRWKRGEFNIFYAQMKIRVGGINGNEPIVILSGDEFEYDGSIVKYAGAEFPQPGLRGAIRDGWATMNPDEIDLPNTFTSDRNVAKSQTINRDLSKVQRRGLGSVETDSIDEDTVLEVSDRNDAMDKVTGRGYLTKKNNRRTPSTAGRRVLGVTQSDIDQQDHTTVSQIKSKANIGVIDITKSKNASLARDLEMSGHESGFGAYSGKRKEGTIIEREGVTIKTNIGNVNHDVKIDNEDEGTVVGKVRHTESRKTQEGLEIRDTSGKPVKPVEKMEKNTIMATKTNSDHKASDRLLSAKKIFDGFPDDWNFFGKVSDKMDRLKQLGSNESMIDALYVVDSAAMKKALKLAFPSHFPD